MLSQSARYYIPEPSRWPIFGSAALLCMALGAASWFNGASWGKFLLIAGLLILVWSMSWFIFSEVMFFAAFFGALFYMRVISVPDLGGLETQQLIWPGFKGGWPASGPGIKEQFTAMDAWGIPALNTLLLLSSGVTVTWAHWGLLKNNRLQLIWGLVMTIALGISFLGFQIYEYAHAISELNLKLSMGAYGATFFMLTGFHGFHVTVGSIMLIVILFRSVAGHFKPEHHFGFEGVAWYWHFVDVVWLLLFVLVYWL
jgi:cytochrome c oxidase subunit 3